MHDERHRARAPFLRGASPGSAARAGSRCGEPPRRSGANNGACAALPTGGTARPRHRARAKEPRRPFATTFAWRMSTRAPSWQGRNYVALVAGTRGRNQTASPQGAPAVPPVFLPNPNPPIWPPDSFLGVGSGPQNHPPPPTPARVFLPPPPRAPPHSQPPCAASLATSARRSAHPSSSRDCFASSSTAATTPRGSPSTPAAASRSSAPSASSRTSTRR